MRNWALPHWNNFTPYVYPTSAGKWNHTLDRRHLVGNSIQVLRLHTHQGSCIWRKAGTTFSYLWPRSHGITSSWKMILLPITKTREKRCEFQSWSPAKMSLVLVAYWLKHWTTDRKVQGSSPTSSRDLFLFWVHSALPQRRFKVTENAHQY